MERDKYLRKLYSEDLNDLSPETQLARDKYVRRIHVASKPRFYALTIIVGRIMPREVEIFVDTYRDVLCYHFWRRVFNGNELEHIEQMTFNFNNLKYFYKGNISYRMLFEDRNTPLSLLSQQSETDIEELARKRCRIVKKELIARHYVSLSSFRSVKI